MPWSALRALRALRCRLGSDEELEQEEALGSPQVGAPDHPRSAAAVRVAAPPALPTNITLAWCCVQAKRRITPSRAPKPRKRHAELVADIAEGDTTLLGATGSSTAATCHCSGALCAPGICTKAVSPPHMAADIVKKHGTAIAVAAKDWVDRYKADRAAATAELLSLLVQSCGVAHSLSSEDVEEGEVDALKERLDKLAVEVGGALGALFEVSVPGRASHPSSKSAQWCRSRPGTARIACLLWLLCICSHYDMLCLDPLACIYTLCAGWLAEQEGLDDPFHAKGQKSFHSNYHEMWDKVEGSWVYTVLWGTWKGGGGGGHAQC